MTFPSGGPGYPQQGGSQQPYQPGPGTGSFPPVPPPAGAHGGSAGSPSLPLLLALGVAALGVIQYFLGFSDEAGIAGGAINYLLVGGLLAALFVLPNGPKALPFAALFSVLGALDALDTVIGIPSEGSTPGIVVVVLILGIVQMAVAVGALLIVHGVVKIPASKPSAPQNPYGQQFGQGGPQQQYGQQPPRFGQQPGQPGQPGQGQQGGQPGQSPSDQPTTYQPPASPNPPQQSTTYAPQQGQFFQQPGSSSEGGQHQSPGTPPGGFGQQS
jgi:hypothetical protein